MDFIKSWFVEPYNKTGCRYLVVDAYNEDVPVAFYKKNGFDFMFSTEEQEKSYRGIVSDKPLKTRLMYFDLILIKQVKKQCKIHRSVTACNMLGMLYW